MSICYLEKYTQKAPAMLCIAGAFCVYADKVGRVRFKPSKICQGILSQISKIFLLTVP